MKLLVINNLLSGAGDGAIFDFLRNFADDGDELILRTSSGTTDARVFLHDADDFDAVVVAGGDGTISSCTHLLADTGIPVLPFAAGTANLLTQNLFLPTEAHALAKIAREMRVMDFDLGMLELSDGTRRGFSIIAGAGWDAKIMEGAEAAKGTIGQMAYFTSAFANATPQFSDIDLTIDGETIHTNGVGVIIINFARIQFDISVVHSNEPRDGKFDIVVFNTKDAFGLLPALFAAILDRGGDFPDRTDAFELYRGAEVEVKANPPLPIQSDGDALQVTTPFKAKVMPAAVRYIVSEKCVNEYSGQPDDAE